MKNSTSDSKAAPLAARIRPRNLQGFIGQKHLLSQGKPLFQAIETGVPHSMILWGPPGTGKTTLARIIAESANAHFVGLSAVMVGLKEVREEIQKAQKRLAENHQKTVFFLDEVHRFNKMQQDAFLPYIEEGIITFIGATTENPSFELNNALLSRTRVYVLKSLKEEELIEIIDNALENSENGYEGYTVEFDIKLKQKLAAFADGDARQILNVLDLLIYEAYLEYQNNANDNKENILFINDDIFKKILTGGVRRFDKKGDNFYEQISALHKAVRGSSPDGALYWFARMIDGGCDPLYIARRVIRMATEDVGLADPRAMEIALNAWEIYERLGSPEGELAIAEAVVYMAVAPKSNAVYMAYGEAMEDAKEFGSLPVPFHIRNAPTSLTKGLGYGKNYRYDHNEENAFAKGQTYFPDEIGEKLYYRPVPRGLEIKIKEKLQGLRENVPEKG